MRAEREKDRLATENERKHCRSVQEPTPPIFYCIFEHLNESWNFELNPFPTKGLYIGLEFPFLTTGQDGRS